MPTDDSELAITRYLIERVRKLETENAAQIARIKALTDFLETLRDDYTEMSEQASAYFEALEG